MKSCFFIISFFLLNFVSRNIALAQHTISGSIINSNTNHPIPFATIEIISRSAGATSDENGNFILYLKEELKGDSIQVNALGYKTAKVKLKPLTSPVTIALEQKDYFLDEITVSATHFNKEAKLGSSKNRSAGKGIYSEPGDQFGLFISNPEKITGTIESVSYYITKQGAPEAPFRVRIYKADGPNNSPGTDLLTENIIVSARKGNQWLKVDLLEYMIELPVDGFYVAFENIKTSDALFYHRNGSKREAYGAVIGMTKEFNEALGWYDYLGSNWNKNEFVVGKTYINPMMRATIISY